MCKVRLNPILVIMRNEQIYSEFQVPTAIASCFSMYLSAYLHTTSVRVLGIPIRDIGSCGTKPASSDAVH